MQTLIVIFVVHLLIVTILTSKWTPFTSWVFLELPLTIMSVITLIMLDPRSLSSMYLLALFLLSNNLSLKLTGHRSYWEYSMPESNVSIDHHPDLTGAYSWLLLTHLLLSMANGVLLFWEELWDLIYPDGVIFW